ncbi:hypothetical protein BJ878DRAFT_18018 [Calycina marina]|uniref:Anaphase-promoting complex subunit 1 n=1 Tax=Calycina marina TaxID=1763456 RepID=A0A9P7Z4J9_9HELO|nr:hypothetical protein BJ878DRAFT_18018 [Calycina marina]
MATVTSLGLHQPTGLQHAIQEQLLPVDPPASAYTWQTLSGYESTDDFNDDELLVTPRCVIWSRGGIFRKSYTFDLEEEEVSQALLTTFPSVGPLTGRDAKAELGVDTTTPDSKSPAIVVFLKTQAHIFFLAGTSHVLHLPFEVESAMEAPQGLIIQRKLRVENAAAASLKFPRVPPNSFVSSQPQPWSAASSVHSTFSISDLGTPKQMPHSTLKELWDPPTSKSDSNWPRLFSLSDPLAEMGLVVTQKKIPGKLGKRSSIKFSALDTAEEIVHISRRGKLSNCGEERSLTLALTLNRETNTYTVWKMSYVGDDPLAREKQRVPSGTTSRRRSSFVPGTATGATTPIPASQVPRESFGVVPNLPKAKKGARMEEKVHEKVVDFAASLDADFENPSIPRRKSRRVSSMLARADLSASHERSAFSELALGLQNGTSRRRESLGGQQARTSIAGHGTASGQTLSQPQFNHSIGSFLEAPLDDLLDELRAGGDFEGFHSMGLDDEEFDSLKQEVVLTKVCDAIAEHSNVRYSTQKLPATSQCKIFTLTAPPAQNGTGNTIVVCVLDLDEKKLIVLTLQTNTHKAAHLAVANEHVALPNTAVTLCNTMRANGVIDACCLNDGHISRMLVLSETNDGFGELSLQSPWGVLMKVNLPHHFAITNIKDLSHDSTPLARRDGGFKRVLSKGPRALKHLRNPKARGLVDLIDDEGRAHQLRIQLEPHNPLVKKAIDVCRAILPGTTGGEGILSAWWNVMQWIRLESVETKVPEWSAFVMTLFTLVLSLEKSPKPPPSKTHQKRKSRSSYLRSSSGIHADYEEWDSMQARENTNGSCVPAWAENRGWQWLDADYGVDDYGASNSDASTPIFASNVSEKGSFTKEHVQLTRTFIATSLGQFTIATCFATTATGSDLEVRKTIATTVVIGLHLLHEEEKLNTMNSDSLSTGGPSMTPILAQLVKWLNWDTWLAYYDTEDAALPDESEPEGSLTLAISEPLFCPSVHSWIEKSLVTREHYLFLTLPGLVATNSDIRIQHDENWRALTPRTLAFSDFFGHIQPNCSAVQMVEALSSAGMDNVMLESLPETILSPLREAIVRCQAEPPIEWSTRLLSIVGREDVNILLTPGVRPHNTQTTLLAPSHEASSDVHTVCISTNDLEKSGAFDGSAEVDRQAITNSIFKDDRRMNEAMSILNTFVPTVARCKAEPHWSESDLLDAQKEHAQMLAYRTLAISSGRGLIYYSARIPLLTQRFPIGGFNLSCVMKPDNNTIGVDKASFTEEKVCWAFFHAGVAAGLSISREARGIDTSWILFNKPLHDLSNRHAGFLLALGLNGHLKSVAKWVAFKYLTPKHTMTSIGLLLGLAASYLGSMDSLVTRLLSVHVTRMLPPGAAELNLSPLTQATGIMGIGLLYCNTQHRRMSEIMVSEIEHIDTELEEEPLRNEGYRLAAGFALGFVNLGKGSDLKGLHDMQLTERLLALAVGAKQVNMVHVLDKATAASVVAFALIYMKSENRVLARKIDVPDSVLQFDYVRPDMFLLRTMARNLIMWKEIVPTAQWIRERLPKVYKHQSALDNVVKLTSDDLPFYNIVAGLCFSIALRFAGSGNILARNVLIYYLDHFMRICQIDADTFDKKLTRNTVRNCQDLLALSAATVMAGTGDLTVFRRLRSQHGRDDSDTPYGSHLAAHLAVGALFLGGGTFTFGTSNLAIAALVVAFYPIFPSTVQDNKSHLQAFRHFWVLATEARCLVARDIDTNQPVQMPIQIALKSDETVQRHTPCLLPDLDQIKIIRTHSQEYWNIALDFEHNASHIASFKASQTIYVRRRPAHGASTSAFQATLQALNDVEHSSSQSLEWLFELPVFATLTKAERALILPPDNGGAGDIHAGTAETVIDSRLVLENATLNSGKRDRLEGLRLLFEWADQEESNGTEVQWIRMEVVQRLKAQVWMLAKEH